jgi:hypothetical protein
MQLFHSGHHDDRRRRVLTEEVIGAAASGASPSARDESRGSTGERTPSAHSYGDAAHMDRQPRITDLIPKRYGTFLLLMLAGLAIVAGLEALYAYMPRLASMTHDGRVAAFDLDGEGSLAVWFSSSVLSAAGLVAILIYYIRRHRLDDYHGRYRVWLWTAACWFMMSIDEGGSLHEGFKEMMTALTGQRLLGDGSVWWVGGYLLVLGILGVRLLFEMRCCRLSTAAMGAAAAVYATAVVTQLQWIMPQSGFRGVMLEEGCEMVGDLFLLLGMGLHARYVILDAQGLLAARPAKRKKPEEVKPARRKAAVEAAAETAGAAKRHDLAPVSKPAATPAAGQRPAQRVVQEEDDDYEDELDERTPRKPRVRHRIDEAEDGPGDRKLNKADRKALRRHKEQQRRGEAG